MRKKGFGTGYDETPHHWFHAFSLYIAPARSCGGLVLIYRTDNCPLPIPYSLYKAGLFIGRCANGCGLPGNHIEHCSNANLRRFRTNSASPQPLPLLPDRIQDFNSVLNSARSTASTHSRKACKSLRIHPRASLKIAIAEKPSS